MTCWECAHKSPRPYKNGWLFRLSPHNDARPCVSIPPQKKTSERGHHYYTGCFKSAVNSKIDDYIDKNDLYILKYNRHNPFFEPNYYDPIIRDEAEYQRITKYIIDNPIQWEKDQLKDSNRIQVP